MLSLMTIMPSMWLTRSFSLIIDWSCRCMKFFLYKNNFNNIDVFPASSTLHTKVLRQRYHQYYPTVDFDPDDINISLCFTVFNGSDTVLTNTSSLFWGIVPDFCYRFKLRPSWSFPTIPNFTATRLTKALKQRSQSNSTISYFVSILRFHFFPSQHSGGNNNYFLLSLLSLFLFMEQGGISISTYPNCLFIYILFYFLLFLGDWFIPSLFTLLLWSHKLGEGRVLSGIHLVTDWRLR